MHRGVGAAWVVMVGAGLAMGCSDPAPPGAMADSGAIVDTGNPTTDAPVAIDTPVSTDGVTPDQGTPTADQGPGDECVGELHAMCGGQCADLALPTHCGSCTNVCTAPANALAQCNAGHCDFGCNTGFTGCGTPRLCVDTLTDNANCGGCGTACPSGLTCVAGACACPGGGLRCGSTCVDAVHDGTNCGACGHACATGQVCVAGACGLVCPPGQTACGGGCVDTAASATHCGGCDTVCPGGAACTASACVCPGGQTLCGAGASARCVDPATFQGDVANCGGCGVACGAGNVCVGGACGAPRVYAVHAPVVDGAHNTITLEGAFDVTTRVNFPGAPTASVTRLGPSRVRIDAPASATAGALTVRTTGTSVSAGVAFRRTGFALGLQAFRSRYEQSDYARQTPSLNTPRVHAAWVDTGAWLYVIGGADASEAALGSVERALLNADGSLGAFERVSPGLTTVREGASAVRVGDSVYVTGGRHNGVNVASVERFTVDATGALSAATTASGPLAAARSGHVTEIIGGYVYVFGGDATTVERAAILDDGALGSFTVLAGVTTRARQRPVVQVLGDSVYLLGGLEGAAALATIERAPIDAAHDTIGAFAAAGSLRSAREGAAAMVLGGKLYVVGGTTGTALATIESADVADDGTLSGFALVTGATLTTPRHGAVSTIVGNYWYLVGGANVDPLGGLDRAQIIGTGTVLGAGQAITGTALAMPGSGIRLIAVGPYVFVIGGQTTSGNRSLVERAAVLADGSLGPFTSRTGTEQGPCVFGPVAVIGPYVYQAGCIASGGRPSRALVGANGDFGTGALTGSGPDNGNGYGSMAVIGANLYGMGGAGVGSATFDSVNHYPINADGSLGAGDGTSPSLPSGRYGISTALLPGGLFSVGGRTGSSALTEVLRATVSTTDTLGSWSAETGQLGTPRSLASAHIIGDRLYMIGGSTDGTTGLTTAEYALIVNGSLTAFSAASGTSLHDNRFFPAAIVINDFLYVVGGLNAGAYLSTIERLPLQ